jgi:ADP-ribose pyrophosphatase YjhB (NUDIX family)
MIAGHVEDGESATQAMIREAKEEAGIDIHANDLNAIYVMDRIDSDRQNIEIFFNCEKYSGELTNMEPNKCGGIEFFDINNLPKNTIPYIKKAIEDIVQDEKYGEFGY